MVFIGISLPHLSHAILCESFSATPVIETYGNLRPFEGFRKEREPNELKIAGFSLQGMSPREAQQQILSRDGVYPIIITDRGTPIMSHRLPNSQVPLYLPHLATHRSLYARAQEIDPGTKIVFAGHLRVVSGKPLSLVDQAGTFHDRIGDHPRVQTQDALMLYKEMRLELAIKALHPYGIVNHYTQTKQILPNAIVPDGHVRDAKVAVYEITLAGNPVRRQVFENLTDFLWLYHNRPHFDVTFKTWSDSKFETLIYKEFFDSILKYGVLDALVKHQDFVAGTNEMRAESGMETLKTPTEIEAEAIAFFNKAHEVVVQGFAADYPVFFIDRPQRCANGSCF